MQQISKIEWIVLGVRERAYNDSEWVREKEKTMKWWCLNTIFQLLLHPIHISRVTVVDEVNSAFFKNEEENNKSNHKRKS